MLKRMLGNWKLGLITIAGNAGVSLLKAIVMVTALKALNITLLILFKKRKDYEFAFKPVSNFAVFEKGGSKITKF